MIVGVVKDFGMTFTGDLFEIALQSNDLFHKFKYLKKNMATVLSKIQVSDPGHVGPLVNKNKSSDYKTSFSQIFLFFLYHQL